MKTDLSKYSAYHGKKWKKRSTNKTLFSCLEYSSLKEILLYSPGQELNRVRNPDSVLHLKKIDVSKIKSEFRKIKKAFLQEGVKVNFINSKLFKEVPPPNLMFVRDLFWSGPGGMIVSKMGSNVRSSEEKYIAASLSLLGKPILLSINHLATFEGADLLWLNPKTLLLGIGNRSNQAAIKQIEFSLSPYGIKIIPIKLPRTVQHLLGLLQIVAKNKVLLRHQIAPKKLAALLLKEKFKIIKIAESAEVRHLQGMNIITLRPNEIFMPDDCPHLKKIYQSHGIKILAELSINEIRKAAGGLACTCGILSRT